RARTLHDIHGEVAHAFKVAVDLDGRGDETQIPRYRLLERQEAGRELVDLNLHVVDSRLVVKDVPRLRFVPFGERHGAAIDRELHQAAHFEQPLPELIELFFKVTHYSNQKSEIRNQKQTSSCSDF